MRKKNSTKVISLNNNVALHSDSFVDPLAGDTRETIVKNCNMG